MDKEQQPNPDDRLLAAEIALGLVDSRVYQVRLEGEPILQALVGKWREDLAPLIDEIEPIEPPIAIWKDLKAQLPSGRSELANQAGLGRPGKLTFSFSRRRWIAGAALAACTTLALFLPLREADLAPPVGGIATPPGILFVSSLLPKDGPPLFIASIDLATATVIAVPAANDTLMGRKLRLWVVPKNDGEPVSIGILATSKPSKFLLTPAVVALTGQDASLVITMEPDDGPERASPGPVVAHGVFVQP